EVTADTDRGADTGRETDGPVLLRDGVVHLSERCTRLNPGRAVLGIDRDGPESSEVDDDEPITFRHVRHALVVVAPASDPDAEAVLPATDDGGLDVRLVGRGHDEDGLRRAGRVKEANVLDG
ncbi:hypothetical protein GW17_00060242, partial [Ensete ventricosum]